MVLQIWIQLLHSLQIIGYSPNGSFRAIASSIRLGSTLDKNAIDGFLPFLEYLLCHTCLSDHQPFWEGSYSL